MASPTTDITVSTLAYVREQFVDNLFRTSAFLDWAKQKKVIKEIEGGKSISHPTLLIEHSTITNLGGGGYNPTSEVVADPLRSADFDWSNSTAPVVLTKVEEVANRGDEARVSILEARLKSVLGMYQREFEKQIFAATSTSLNDLQSFNGIDAATGWLEEVAFGSQANTIGGIAKASFTTAWQNQVGDASANFATNGLREMSDIIIQAMTFAPEGQVDGIFASPTSFGLYKDTLQAQERYTTSEPTLDAGKISLAYAGAPMYVSQHLGFTGSGGSNRFSMVFLNSKSLVVYFDKGGMFELLDPVPVSAHLAHRQDVFLRVQMAASHVASLGALFNAEA